MSHRETSFHNAKQGRENPRIIAKQPLTIQRFPCHSSSRSSRRRAPATKHERIAYQHRLAYNRHRGVRGVHTNKKESREHQNNRHCALAAPVPTITTDIEGIMPFRLKDGLFASAIALTLCFASACRASPLPQTSMTFHGLCNLPLEVLLEIRAIPDSCNPERY